MSLRTITKKNHKAAKDGQCLHPEAEVAPPLVSPEEEYTQHAENNYLNQSIVRQQERFESPCEEDAGKV